MTNTEMIDAYRPSQRSLERASLMAIVGGKVWMILNNTIFRFSWRFNGFRMLLMRLFGAKLNLPQGEGGMFRCIPVQ